MWENNSDTDFMSPDIRQIDNEIPTFATLSSPLTDDWEVTNNSFPPSHLTAFKATMNYRQNSLQ